MRRDSNRNPQPSVTRFALGQTFVTPGAEEALQITGQTAIEFLRRHMSCKPVDTAAYLSDAMRVPELI